MAWTNYFDDFVTFAKADEMSSVAGSIKFVFKALGCLTRMVTRPLTSPTASANLAFR